MTKRQPMRPRDPNQLAKLIADVATGHVLDDKVKELSGQAKLGQMGGKTGDERGGVRPLK